MLTVQIKQTMEIYISNSTFHSFSHFNYPSHIQYSKIAEIFSYKGIYIYFLESLLKWPNSSWVFINVNGNNIKIILKMNIFLDSVPSIFSLVSWRLNLLVKFMILQQFQPYLIELYCAIHNWIKRKLVFKLWSLQNFSLYNI